MQPVPEVRLVLVSADWETPYSGMLPGLIAGHYSRAEIHVDLHRLCRFAGGDFYRTRVTGLDLKRRLVHVAGRPGDRYLSFQGTGQMSFGGGPEVNVAIGYRPETRELYFNTDVENGQGVLKLTDHLVLFKAGIGVTLGTTQPVGELATTATIGLFARGTVSSPPQEGDFHLIVRNARTRLQVKVPVPSPKSRMADAIRSVWNCGSYSTCPKTRDGSRPKMNRETEIG